MILSLPILLALCLPAIVIVAWLAVELQAERRVYNLKGARRWNRGFADLLNYAALVRPDVILNKDGALMGAFEFAGDDTSTRSHEERRRRIAWINRLLLNRDAGWMFHYDMIRRPATPLEDVDFAGSDGQRVLAQERLEHATDRYVNRYLLAVTYLPPTDASTKRLNYLFEEDTKAEVSFARVLDTFTRGLADIEDHLAMIGSVRRLGEHRSVNEHGELVTRSELLGALVDVLYGVCGDIRVAPTPVMLSGLLGAQDLAGGVNPRLGRKHLRVLTIAGFPPSSYPGVLDALQAVKTSFRFSTRIVVEDTSRARAVLDRAFRNWFGKRTSLAAKALEANASARINRDADDMADDAEAALQAADRGLVRYVYYTGTIVLMDDDFEAIEAAARALKKVFAKAMFLVREESINAIDAYLGSLWGDGYHNLRKYMLHTVNAGDLLVSSSEWRGRVAGDCEYCKTPVEPILTAKTKTGGDFAYELHYQDIMHFAVLGATGGGKTTLLNATIGNFFRRPDDQVFALDFGYGMYTTAQFLGATHVDPRGLSGSIRFGLFAYLDEPDELQWLIDYLEIIAEVNRVAVTPRHREVIEKALNLMLSTPPAFRSLSTFVQKLNDRDGDLTRAFIPYTSGGAFDGILDGTGDDLPDSNFVVFELSNILGGDERERIAAPIMLLLFHWIKRRLRENRRTLVPTDEAWASLRSPAVLPKIDEMLRTYRKLHAGAGFATQNLNDVVDSPIASTILSGCATKILLPNPAAAGSFRKFYASEGMGCTDAEIAAIATATQKREYYFKSQDGSGMIDLNLSRGELAVYGRGGMDDVNDVRKLIGQHPTTWREELLRSRGCTRAADRLTELRRAQITVPTLMREGLALA